MHSIGLLLFRRKQHVAFEQFVTDVILRSNTQVAAMPSTEMGEVARVSMETGLDFDNAYQTALARRRSLAVVSFDADYDRPGVWRMTRLQILNV